MAASVPSNQNFPRDRRRRALELLGLAPTATVEEIHRAYREAAKTAHPDLGGDPKRFIELQRAYESALRGAPAQLLGPTGGPSGSARARPFRPVPKVRVPTSVGGWFSVRRLTEICFVVGVVGAIIWAASLQRDPTGFSRDRFDDGSIPQEESGVPVESMTELSSGLTGDLRDRPTVDFSSVRERLLRRIDPGGVAWTMRPTWKEDGFQAEVVRLDLADLSGEAVPSIAEQAVGSPKAMDWLLSKADPSTIDIREGANTLDRGLAADFRRPVSAYDLENSRAQPPYDVDTSFIPGGTDSAGALSAAERIQRGLDALRTRSSSAYPATRIPRGSSRLPVAVPTSEDSHAARSWNYDPKSLDAFLSRGALERFSIPGSFSVIDRLRDAAVGSSPRSWNYAPLGDEGTFPRIPTYRPPLDALEPASYAPQSVGDADTPWPD